MATEDGTTTNLDLETVNALESPHIVRGSTRHAGSKRSANGNVDQRPQQKRRLEAASPLEAEPNQESGLQRSLSEEIVSKSALRKTMDSTGSPSAQDDEPDDELAITPSNGANTNGLPLPMETAPFAESLAREDDGKPLSKNQQKKLRKKAEWEAKRPERKAERKEKLIAKKARRKAAREEGGDAAEEVPVRRPAQQKRSQLPVTFLIDCDFDDLMRDNERISLASQVTRSYSDTRKSVYYPHLAVCSFGGELKKRFDTILTHHKGWKNIHFVEENFLEASELAKDWMTDPKRGNKLDGTFSPLSTIDPDSQADLKDQGEVVYLTSESSETLTTLKPYSTYIIGGLVDKNREKGICYRRATQAGVKTAKLPIGEFMDMTSRKVLATNHVNEIMLKYLECGDWGEAFVQVIPKRKGGKLKDGGEKEGEQGDEREDEEDGQEEQDGVNGEEDANAEKRDDGIDESMVVDAGE